MSDLPEFPIAELSLSGGVLGISPMPGRTGRYQADVTAVLHWGPDLVLTMTEFAELAYADAETFGQDLADAGILWRHLPISDMGAPPATVQARWPEASASAHRILRESRRVLAHCYGGCGRSGMAVLRLMVEAGEDPDVALHRLRQVRPCAVETEAQRAWAAEGALTRWGP